MQSLITTLTMGAKLSVMSIPITLLAKYFQIAQSQVVHTKDNLIDLQENILEVFRDLPDRLADPAFPTVAGLDIDHDPDLASFEDFFKDNDNQYVDNPFGKDFIKLEVDLDRFDTNKTSKNIIFRKS